MFFGLLGAMEVRADDGSALGLGGARARALLALLLLHAPRPVSTEALLDGVYGDAPPADARNALQAQVSRLRRRLGDATLIEAHPAGYHCAADQDDIDVHRFTALARRGREALAAGRPDEAAPALRAALALWRGPALADLLDAPFAEPHAARLTEARVDAAQDAAQARLLLGDSAGLVAELTELAAAHPLRERLRVLLMRALHADGRQADALAVFADARDTLAEELGADPSAELAEAHLAVLRAESGPRPAALPAQFSSFVGRETELRELAGLLGSARLVTVIGVGGAGKTRLAIEAAHRVDGEACFVDLAAVTGGAEVAPAILGALGLRVDRLFDGAAADPAQRLLAALRERRVLLVLDNCEQIVARTAALLHRLLGACPGVRVLATSREAFGIPGEALCPLAPLDPDGAAVRLFADRAAAVRPGFTLDDAVLPAVRRVCAALDGLPLAIELAAARARTLDPEQLAARLDDRFRLLSKGNRGAAQRHQTLHALVAWSWELLGEAEQRLLRRLAVFAGGAETAAVSVVCGLSEVDAEELLTGLVDKSLLELTSGRYRMLETIRAFSAERLDEAGERDRFAAAHAAYHLELARTADGYLRRAEQLAWLDRLAAEHANVTAALRWCVTGDVRLGLRLVGALSGYWRLRGVRGEFAPLAAALLAAAGDEPPVGLAEEYLLCLLGSTPELDEAGLRRAERLLWTLNGPPRQPYLMVIWALLVGPPEPDAPLPPVNQAFLDSGDEWCRALFHFSASYLLLYQGGAAGAAAELDLSLAGFRAIGDRWGSAQVLDSLAVLADLRDETDRAITLTDEAIDLVAALRATEELAELECRRAERLLRRGDAAAAESGYRRSLELARRTGAPAVLAMAHRGFAELHRHRGETAEARRRCALALDAAGPDWQSRSIRSRVLLTLGRVACAEGETAEAQAALGEALELALRQRSPLEIAEAAEGLAAALADAPGDAPGDAGEPARAAGLLGLATRVRGGSTDFSAADFSAAEFDTAGPASGTR